MPDLHVKQDISALDQKHTDLISEVSQGNEQALATLYDRTSTLVYSLALRILNDPTMAEEVTLDVYMQVWQRASQFDASRGKLIVWLAVLTRSRSIDRLRVGRNERANRDYLDQPQVQKQLTTQENPETLSVINDQYRIVQEALVSLSHEQRQVIEMAYFGGLSQSEIANQIDKPLGTVKTRIRLGMIKLRDILSSVEKGHVL